MIIFWFSFSSKWGEGGGYDSCHDDDNDYEHDMGVCQCNDDNVSLNPDDDDDMCVVCVCLNEYRIQLPRRVWGTSILLLVEGSGASTSRRVWCTSTLVL